jgi:hypothetical protein
MGARAHSKEIFYAYIHDEHERLCPLNGIGQGRGNLNLPAFMFTLGFNKFRVQSERYYKNQVLLS